MARKTGLGKGLGSLLSEASAESGISVPETTLPIGKVKPNPNQPRKNFDEQALAELTDSIAQNGILQPLLVRKKGSGYEIIAGERRYQAAKRAGLKELPVAIREVSDDEVLQLALIENLQRDDLNAIEEARGYQQLIDMHKLTQEALGKMLSKSRSAITNTLRLLDLPPEVQDLIEEGKISAGHARAILAVSTEEGRVRLGRKVATESLSVRETERLAPLFSTTNVSRRVQAVSPQSYKRAAKRLRDALETNVRVKQVRGKNKIEIEFADEDDLARILELLV